MAKKKNGSIRPIIRNTAPSLPIDALVNRYVGTPTAAAEPKQINCLFVRFKATFVLTVLKSLGTGTNGKKIVTENFFQRVL